MSAPGWYPDPNGQPYQRWWDGTQWTDQTQAAQQTQQQQQAPPAWQQLQQAGAPMPFAQPAVMSPEQARQWAMFAHLSALAALLIGFPFLGPLIIYLVKKDEDQFVADQAREALNFNLTAMIAFVISIVLIFVIIGIFLLPLLGIAWLILTIVAGVQANKGLWYRYPLTIRFINT